MAQRTSDQFARGTSYRSGNSRNERTGGDDSCNICNNRHSDQRQPCLAGGEHADRTLGRCATRANSAASSTVRNAHPMVDGVVFILVEPAGYNAPAGSRAARKGRGNCCPRTCEPLRTRFSRTIHRLHGWYRMMQQAIAARSRGERPNGIGTRQGPMTICI
jgi:hypothetical protein